VSWGQLEFLWNTGWSSIHSTSLSNVDGLTHTALRNKWGRWTRCSSRSWICGAHGTGGKCCRTLVSWISSAVASRFWYQKSKRLSTNADAVVEADDDVDSDELIELTELVGDGELQRDYRVDMGSDKGSSRTSAISSCNWSCWTDQQANSTWLRSSCCSEDRGMMMINNQQSVMIDDWWLMVVWLGFTTATATIPPSTPNVFASYPWNPLNVSASHARKPWKPVTVDSCMKTNPCEWFSGLTCNNRSQQMVGVHPNHTTSVRHPSLHENQPPWAAFGPGAHLCAKTAHDKCSASIPTTHPCTKTTHDECSASWPSFSTNKPHRCITELSLRIQINFRMYPPTCIPNFINPLSSLSQPSSVLCLSTALHRHVVFITHGQETLLPFAFSYFEQFSK